MGGVGDGDGDGDTEWGGVNLLVTDDCSGTCKFCLLPVAFPIPCSTAFPVPLSITFPIPLPVAFPVSCSIAIVALLLVSFSVVV